MKVLAGLLFIFGVPLLCVFLLLKIRKSNRSYKLLGWSLFIIGGFMSLLTTVTYIPEIITAFHRYEDIVGFLVWFVPSIFMVFTGWFLRKKRKD